MFLVSSVVPILLRRIRFHLFILVLLFMILRGWSKKDLPHFLSKCVLLLESFAVSVLFFRSSIWSLLLCMHQGVL